MPDLPQRKVGLIACSGEDLPEGTVTREAALIVLERLRPGDTVTLCLPLFLAGEERERAFARFFPTIAVDGCAKRCAARATEKYSACPAASLVVEELRADRNLERPQRVRGADAAREALAAATAEALAREVNRLLGEETLAPGPLAAAAAPAEVDPGGEAVCICTTDIPAEKIEVDGQVLEVVALPAIFALLREEGRRPADETTADAMMQQVRIYNSIPSESEGALRRALLSAYEVYWAGAEEADESQLCRR